MGIATIEHWGVHTPRQWPKLFKQSSKHDIYKLNGIDHLFDK